MVLPRGDNIAVFGDMCYNQGAAIGIWWLEARDADKHPTVPRTVPITKSDPA